jgi:hypothetical protein
LVDGESGDSGDAEGAAARPCAVGIDGSDPSFDAPSAWQTAFLNNIVMKRMTSALGMFITISGVL